MNTRTQQQDVNAAEEKFAQLKQDWMSSLHKYCALDSAQKDEREAVLLECQQRANIYFNEVETFVRKSSLLGAHEDALWAHGFAEDCAELLKSMPAHYELLKKGFAESKRLSTISSAPGATAFANMQRMVKVYLTKEESTKIRSLFVAASLPTYGFDNKAKTPMKIEKLLAFAFGITFVVTIMVIAWLKPEPSKFQYSVYWTALALAAGGIGAVLPGTLNVTVSKWVRAGGALALFVVVYFWLPAQLQ